MKLTAEYIKTNYLILSIKLLIVSFFILSLKFGIQRITDYYFAFANYNDSRFTEYLNITINESFFKPAIFLLIPLIGIFINKKTGWILIQSYFYYLISNLSFSAKFIDLTDKTLIFTNFIGFSLVLLIILIMNKHKIRNQTYGIAKTELISKNIIASIIGISITIISAVTKANGI